MTFPAHNSALRKLLCIALLATMAANAHAGALADGLAIAGELYAASLVGGAPPARKSVRADLALADAPAAPGDRRGDRVAAGGVQGCGCGAAGAADDASDGGRGTPEDAAGGARVAPRVRRCAGPRQEAPDGSRTEGKAAARVAAP